MLQMRLEIESEGRANSPASTTMLMNRGGEIVQSCLEPLLDHACERGERGRQGGGDVNIWVRRPSDLGAEIDLTTETS